VVLRFLDVRLGVSVRSIVAVLIPSKTSRSVEIAGAGLSGLALATRLAQLGWETHLHERSSDLRMFGSGIWLWENGLKSLKLLGAYERAVHRARRVREWHIADGSGTVIYRKLLQGRDRLLLPPRADLYEALIEQAVAAGVNIHTSSVASSVRPDGTLILESGEERSAHLVVIADGAFSRLRECILATSWIDFGIEGGFRALIARRAEDSPDIITEYWSKGWRAMFNPCTDGSNYIYMGGPVNDRRGRQMPIDPQFWRTLFPGAGNLFDNVTELSRWDRLVNVRTLHWSEGQVAIIGDAAHAMVPNLGQAANMAFSNAMALAMEVDKTDDIPRALKEWEMRQRPLTDHVQWWSYIYGLILCRWPSAVESLRSDLVRMLAKSQWFDDGMYRGARHTPAGYDASEIMSAHTSSIGYERNEAGVSE
jgi:2-polyprenyl-6-methoxyphenol hydroxylase-like FAD-dependent oxidoreductase